MRSSSIRSMPTSTAPPVRALGGQRARSAGCCAIGILDDRVEQVASSACAERRPGTEPSASRSLPSTASSPRVDRRPPLARARRRLEAVARSSTSSPRRLRRCAAAVAAAERAAGRARRSRPTRRRKRRAPTAASARGPRGRRARARGGTTCADGVDVVGEAAEHRLGHPRADLGVRARAGRAVAAGLPTSWSSAASRTGSRASRSRGLRRRCVNRCSSSVSAWRFDRWSTPTVVGQLGHRHRRARRRRGPGAARRPACRPSRIWSSVSRTRSAESSAIRGRPLPHQRARARSSGTRPSRRPARDAAQDPQRVVAERGRVHDPQHAAARGRRGRRYGSIRSAPLRRSRAIALTVKSRRSRSASTGRSGSGSMRKSRCGLPLWPSSPGQDRRLAPRRHDLDPLARPPAAARSARRRAGPRRPARRPGPCRPSTPPQLVDGTPADQEVDVLGRRARAARRGSTRRPRRSRRSGSRAISLADAVVRGAPRGLHAAEAIGAKPCTAPYRPEIDDAQQTSSAPAGEPRGSARCLS